MLVFDEVAECGAEAGGDEVGGEAEEDGGFGAGGGVAPVFLSWRLGQDLALPIDRFCKNKNYHVIDYSCGFCYRTGLKAHVCHF